MNKDVRRFLTQPRWEVHRRRSVETPVEVFTVTGEGPAGPLIGGTIAVVVRAPRRTADRTGAPARRRGGPTRPGGVAPAMAR